MENKKSLLIVLSLTLSAHLVLFANLRVEEVVQVQEKPMAQISKINLKNVVIKKPEKKVEPIVEPVKKQVEIIKPLPKTLSKNIVKESKKTEHKKRKKTLEKKVEKIKDKETQPQQMASNIPTKVDKDDHNLKEALENEYLAKIKKTIEKNKTYPKIAKRLNQMGKVDVKFVISKDGKIFDARIVKKSNFERLDSAAIEILTKINNFEPIPDKLNKNSWEITVPIVYQIIRS
uniref:energy transducer TonB n=1 Tax=Aliarcobacter sp. TaxID=2321116 RepID=UPI0040487827